MTRAFKVVSNDLPGVYLGEGLEFDDGVSMTRYIHDENWEGNIPFWSVVSVTDENDPAWSFPKEFKGFAIRKDYV